MGKKTKMSNPSPRSAGGTSGSVLAKKVFNIAHLAEALGCSVP
jgi:hypothetical protein